MTRIGENSRIYQVDGVGIAFQYLEKAPIDIQQHPRDITFGVGSAGMSEQRGKLGLAEARHGRAGVYAVDQLRHDASPDSQRGIATRDEFCASI